MADDSLPAAADLAALVGSRLCHDLISPLGAIGNGVELLGLSVGGAGSPELALIGDSVAHANARLKFFRVAFGQAGGEQRLGQPEIATLLADLARGGRLEFHLQAVGDQSRREVKAVFLSLLCFESALPWGGKITIARSGEAWALQGQAQRIKPEPALWARLDGGAAGAPLTPAQVQFALLPREVTRLGRTLAWEIDDTCATITF